MTDTITLKHICREFGIDPYPLRQELRKNFDHKPNQRWRWQPDDPQLKQVRELAAQIKQPSAQIKDK